MTTENLIKITSGIVIFNLIIGHNYPPNGIFLYPFVIISIGMIILVGKNNLNLIQRSVILSILIALHDIGIKLYSGGIHDRQGLGWINLMFFTGTIPVALILIGQLIRNKVEPSSNKLIALTIFTLIITIHQVVFSDLGV